MKKIFYISILFIISMVPAAISESYDAIAQAIREGNYKQLSSYFNKSVELNILSHEENYTKIEAEAVLKDFFMKNPPKSFTLLHQGNSKEGAIYAIGSLVTTQGANLRTYFFVKQISGRTVIQELRFEKE
jgi:hypothetical protein